jgi:hypothetical protein
MPSVYSVHGFATSRRENMTVETHLLPQEDGSQMAFWPSVRICDHPGNSRRKSVLLSVRGSFWGRFFLGVHGLNGLYKREMKA